MTLDLLEEHKRQGRLITLQNGIKIVNIKKRREILDLEKINELILLARLIREVDKQTTTYSNSVKECSFQHISTSLVYGTFKILLIFNKTSIRT